MSLVGALLLLAVALRSYGNWLYVSGRSVHEFRHTILALQRKFIGLKPYAETAWELVSRWEHAEPPCHRTPVPEPLLRAMVVLAWLLDWWDLAGVTLLAFYGLGRLGEVLACSRDDLLLPRDCFKLSPSGQVSELDAWRAPQAGSAVHCYRRGVPVCKKWRMRLKNQATLGFYLQEVGAITALGWSF